MKEQDEGISTHLTKGLCRKATDPRRGGIKLNIGFIGAGKVGYSLGKYLAEKAGNLDKDADIRINLKGYYSLHRESSQAAAEFTNSKSYDNAFDLMDECDMIFITVPDGSIKKVWKEISGHNIKGKLICHCSGAMSSEDAFEGIGETGASGFSIHPLFAVSDKFETYKELTGVFFTLEGSGEEAAEHLSMIKNLFENMGNPARIISPDKKNMYHCSAAMASNLVCGLIDQSIELMKRCGFEESDAVKALAPILMGNMAHIAESGPTASLTGPIERNDTVTVRKHLECLEDASEKELYSLLSNRLVNMAQRRHPDRDYNEMSQMLRKEELK